MKKLIAACLLILPLTTSSQVSRLGEDVAYKAELTGAVSNGSHMPFWFTSNRYGLGSIHDNYGYLRGQILRDTQSDSLRNWRVGYGVDAVAAAGMDNHVVLQQLYAEVQWRMLRLSLGQKERPLELKNQLLSSGGMTTGINARPVPQLRLEIPDFWTVPGTKGWFALKAHLAYGAYTDNGWQRKFTKDTNYKYSANSLYHTKALLLRIGNTEKLPITLSGGLEMSTQFGGEAWNLTDRMDHASADEFSSHQKLPKDIKAYWHALIPGGNDVNDGDYSNAEGNHVGSWHLRLDGEWQDWKLGLYAEHFFDDHSQMFLQYPWKDMLYGGELHFPQNPFVTDIVYEHLRTTHQSGPIYHDGTQNMPDEIFGNDDYYNHQIYGAWQHAGFGMGHPLLLSPIYNESHEICVADNRITAHHIGISGDPYQGISYRILFTHERSLGRYYTPRINPVHGNYFMAEATLTPAIFIPALSRGLTLTIAYGQNGGSMLAKSKGALLTIAYRGHTK